MSAAPFPFPHPLPTLDRLEGMTQDELDALPFGVLELTEEGIVERINELETHRTGLSRAQFLGRNFFTEIAPCTDLREFSGTFREGVRRGALEHTFRWIFPFPTGEQHVVVHLASQRPGHGWVLITT